MSDHNHWNYGRSINEIFMIKLYYHLVIHFSCFNSLSFHRVKIFHSQWRHPQLFFKVAPYSSTIACSLMTKAQVICTRSKENTLFLWKSVRANPIYLEKWQITEYWEKHLKNLDFLPIQNVRQYHFHMKKFNRRKV